MHRWLAALVFAVCLSISQGALALGLGEITARSNLNEPMQAEIALIGATRDELTTLEIRLASGDTFARYGINRPSFLNGLKFRVRGGVNPVIEITSSQPITEPFVTMLVEAVWPRGRLLREYTVLLDPPMFAAPASQRPATAISQAPVPVQRNSANTATVRRSAPQAAPVDPIEGDQYRVQRNDTLWEIAERIQPDDSVSINQVMLAIYEANPQAFGGNINRLNAGAVLSLPNEQALYAINRTAALQEVQRQNRDWRGGGSLTLVAPDDETFSGSVSATDERSGSEAAGTATSAELSRLQRELAEKERLLAIRNEELARLQSQLASQADDVEPVATDDVPVPTDDLYSDQTPADEPVEAIGSDEIFVESDDELLAADSADPSATQTQAEPPTATPAASTTTPAVVTTRAPEPSLMEKIIGGVWLYVVAGILLIVGILVFLARRRAQQSDGPTGTWESLDAAELEDLDGTLAATGRLRDIGSSRGAGDTVRTPPLADNADSMEATAPVAEIAASTTAATDDTIEDSGYSIEDTFSSDTAINLDQSDPLAEADFHMAYGLYDQAADLVKGAMAHDQKDVRLKAKLCEIYFVWGNQDGFVDAASDLKSSVGGQGSEWNKVVIMGQQIAPAHALFSGAVASSDAGELDMSFDGAMSADVIDAEIGGDDDGFGEVFENSSGVSDGGTVEQLADISGIDFEFDESAMLGGSDDDAETGSRSGIDFEFDGTSLDDGGTVEQRVDIDTGDVDSGATAEIDIADLDLDTGSNALADTSGDISADLLEATGVTSVLPDDFKVSLPGESGADDETVLAPTGSMDLDDFNDDDETGTQKMADFEAGGSTSATRPGGLGEVDLDIADLTSELSVDDIGADDDATVQQPAVDSSSTLFSEQVFGGDDSVDSAADTGLNLALDDDDESSSIAEVGTKLDLARAYVDMGDPEGARSILDEVMEEGDDSQRDEAKKLLDSLG